MKTTFAIGCLVQWYEAEIIEEYLDSLADAIKFYDGKVLVDVLLVANEDLEKCESEQLKELAIQKVRTATNKHKIELRETSELVTIANYRRLFNEAFCTKADVLIWGESDMLVPQQCFPILDSLHNSVQTPKYLATFGICKMWDDSWKILEHPKFTDKPFFDSPYDFDPEKHWWSLRYTMSKEEMDRINSETEELEVTVAPKHKFNGCGLVISSEVIKAGVNIPQSVFFVHEDTSFMLMTQKILGNIPQYIIKNILVVHNRNHPKKRMWVVGEEGDTMNKRRRSNDWYVKANKFSEENCYNLFNPNYKSFSWKDV